MNENLLDVQQDDTFSSGDIGLIAGSFEDTGVHIQFDNFYLIDLKRPKLGKLIMKRTILRIITLICILSTAACQSFLTRGQNEDDIATTATITSTPTPWVTIAPFVATASPQVLPTLVVNDLDGKLIFHSDRDETLMYLFMISRNPSWRKLQMTPLWMYSPGEITVGRKLFFVSDRDGNPEIYLKDQDSQEITRLTNDLADDVFPVISPDGETIAFVSNRDGDDEIYLMDMDGANIRQLTHNTFTDGFPSWSPDSENIVYQTNRDVNYELYIMSTSGLDLMRVTNDPAADVQPSWGPDGIQIAFISTRSEFEEIYIYNLETGSLAQMTTFKASTEMPGWNPNGRYLTFSSNYQGNREIYVMDVEKRTILNVTDSPAEDFYSSWLP